MESGPRRISCKVSEDQKLNLFLKWSEPTFKPTTLITEMTYQFCSL